MPEPKSPYKRVRRSFNQQTLKRVCEMHENEFAGAYDMEMTLVNQLAPDDFYLYQDNGADIIAVAHLDTVGPHAQRTANYVNTSSGPVIYSRALDDRLGAYTILELLPKLGIQYDILLTVGEESGRSTAQFFKPPKEYNWMIEFDRGGTDVVLYQYDDNATRSIVRACGAKVGDGIFSDISYMDHLEIKGFNWGVGYRDYHGPRAHAFLEDYWMMIGHFLKFHEANQDVYLPHENDGRGMYGGFSSGRLWTDTWNEPASVPDDLVDAGLIVDAPWDDDSNWGEAEWDAYIDGGIEAVRELFQNDVRMVLDDDGDIVSDDYEIVKKAIDQATA